MQTKSRKVGVEKLRRNSDARGLVFEPSGEIWRFTFPPGVTHAFQTLGVSAALIVSFNAMPHDPANPDVTRDVIL